MKRFSPLAILALLPFFSFCGTDVERVGSGGGSGSGQVGALSVSPGAGNYPSAVTVTVSTVTTGASIRCTTDGTEPTEHSSLYTSPLTISQTTTLRCRGFHADLEPSAIGTWSYTIGTTPPADQVLPPSVTPSTGSYSSPVTVTMTPATAGSEIRYTLDGTDPTEGSTLYGSPFTISQDKTVRAKGFKPGMTPSTTVDRIYDITATVRTAQIQMSLNVDDIDRIRIQDGVMSLIHQSGERPQNPYVKITKWDGSVKIVNRWELDPFHTEGGITCAWNTPGYNGNSCVSAPLDLGLGAVTAGGANTILPSSLGVVVGRGSVTLNAQNQIVISDPLSSWSYYWITFTYSYMAPI
jgi:hypothetical protein